MSDSTNYQDDAEKAFLSIMMDVIDISEKFHKMGPKEVPTMISTAFASTKKNVMLKKVLDLESKLVTLRTSLTKGSIHLALQKDTTTETAEVESLKAPRKKKEEPVVEIKKEEPVVVQPVEVPIVEPKEEKPKKKAVKKEEPKEEPKKEEVKEPVVEVPQPGGTEEAKEPIAEEVSETQPIHIRRKKIPKQIKTLVWNEYIGRDLTVGRCYCCKKETIANTNYHCGHVIAESKGGDLTIKNLRPVCAPCNLSMGTQSMNEFTKTFFGWEI